MPLNNITAFTTDEYHRIQHKLNEKLDKDDISYRPSAAGNVAYIEGWRTFNLANQVFGFNGWSSEILQFSQDFCEVDAAGRVSVGMSCMVRVYLKDGTFHDDIGYGSSEGQRAKGAAFEKAKKEAVTDAMKRALRVFGNRLGNCAYDKVFLRDVKNGTLPAAVKPPFVPNLVSVPQPQMNIPQSIPQMNIPQSIPTTSNNNNNNNNPPADYKPAWQPARAALSPSSIQPPTHPTHPKHSTHQTHSTHPQLHSDDFDALITEADLYDLEMS